MCNRLVVEDTTQIKRFRTSKDLFLEAGRKNINNVGLDDLNISGSGVFNVKELVKKINTKLPIIVVDLRQESHFYVDGTPITALQGFKNAGNKGKTAPQIEAEENKIILELKERKKTSFQKPTKKLFGIGYNYKKMNFSYNIVNSEEDEVERSKLIYKRFYVQDHYPPSTETLKKFIKFVNSIPQNHWIHYHCRGGAGRTTTFMILHDIIKNKDHNLYIQDYFARHSKDKDLRSLPLLAPWKLVPAIKRYLLIYKFYHEVVGQK